MSITDLPIEIMIKIASYLDMLMPLLLTNKTMYSLKNFEDLYEKNIRNYYLKLGFAKEDTKLKTIRELDYTLAKYSDFHKLNKPEYINSYGYQNVIVDLVFSSYNNYDKYYFITRLLNITGKQIYNHEEFMKICKSIRKTKHYELLSLIIENILGLSCTYNKIYIYAIIHHDIKIFIRIIKYELSQKKILNIEDMKKYIKFAIENDSEDIALYILNLPFEVYDESLINDSMLKNIDLFGYKKLLSMDNYRDYYRVDIVPNIRIVYKLYKIFREIAKELKFTALVNNCTLVNDKFEKLLE